MTYRLILILVGLVLVSGCTQSVRKSMQGKPVFDSLSRVPANAVKAWDTGYEIMVCIAIDKPVGNSSKNYIVGMVHPAGKHDPKYRQKIRDQFVFSDNIVTYEARRRIGTDCDAYVKRWKKDPVEIPVVSMEALSEPGFIEEHPEAVYFRLEDHRIVSLGYFSKTRMFGRYNNINIDLRKVRVMSGRTKGNPMAVLFLPFAAAVDVTAATVSFGVVGVACSAGKNCK